MMNDLSTHGNSLGKIDLTIGDTKKVFSFCPGPLTETLDINCSSWNASEYIMWNDTIASSCSINNAQCVRLYNDCICHCLPGFVLVDGTCLKSNLELNNSCELTEQCIQPFSDCFQGKCKCINGYSAFETDSCLKDNVPVSGFCSLHDQCTGSNNSGICEQERCTCAEGFKLVVFACKKNPLRRFKSSKSQNQDTNIGVTLGTFFGGLILGVATTLTYRKLKCRTRKRKKTYVMVAENKVNRGAEFVDSAAQISFKNAKEQRVAFSKATPGYNLSGKHERTEDVYNHLHEQTEQDDDTYDHACAVPNHSADLSDYSYIRDTATVRPSPSEDRDDYSTLRH
nr:uncharacterized protein LOC105343519 isoform X2 [Crassostrea gigas]